MFKINWKDSVFHDGTEQFVRSSYKIGENTEFIIRLLNNSPIKSVFINFFVYGECAYVKMVKFKSTKYHDYYHAIIPMQEKEFSYKFILSGYEETYYYNQFGVYDYKPTDTHNFKLLNDFDGPSWIDGRVFYQIYPDRFHEGDPSTSVKTGEYKYQGNPSIKRETGQNPLEYHDGFCLDFFGGDLPGIRKKIDYLKKLSIGGLYLNPIFSAPSNHKYDCDDYYNVDKHFGSNRALSELTDECHKNDIKVMVDISVNHVGTSHKWFNREKIYGENVGAYNDPNSKEANYFINQNGGFHRWHGVDDLVTLNYKSEELKDIIYRNKDSVLKYWLQNPFNIDGWRFDVAHNMARLAGHKVNFDVFKDIRKELKKEKKDIYLISEIWTDCIEYLSGDMFDATMNYFGFGLPVREFFGETEWYLQRIENNFNFTNRSSRRLVNSFRQDFGRLPYQIQKMQYNLLNSHDIYRMHNREGLSYDSYISSYTMLLTYLGVPSIYYGDETYIDGHTQSNEGCRYPIRWENNPEQSKSFDFFAKLNKLKTTRKSLIKGSLMHIYSEGRVLIYARFFDEECTLVVVSEEESNKQILVPLLYAGDFTKRAVFKEYFNRHIDVEQNMGFLNIEIKSKTSLIFVN